MSVFVKRSGLVLVLAALCLAGRTAGAQTVTYSSWPIGFYSNLTVGQGSNIYGSFAGFDGSDARGGFSTVRYAFPNGWFVGGGTGGLGFSMNGINQASAFGSSLTTEGVQVGYKFQNGLPLTVYAGFDTMKYNTGIGSPFAPFDTTSGTLPGYRANVGVEFQPAPNLSLSLGVGYTQAPARLDSDLNSLVLPGAAPFGRR
jgi:hypothetical protein